MGEREVNVLVMSNNEEHCGGFPDYVEQIIEIVHKFRNKKLLKRVYELAEYLYLYEDGE